MKAAQQTREEMFQIAAPAARGTRPRRAIEHGGCHGWRNVVRRKSVQMEVAERGSRPIHGPRRPCKTHYREADLAAERARHQSGELTLHGLHVDVADKGRRGRNTGAEQTSVGTRQVPRSPA